ncbi:helix-turn-helix domain-containing protein [Candidatus Saccharibacteria bacterium]|uniref:DNA-packaging protein n=1 Tax=Heyndrickxia coagulans TaxID=1398 RepID=UPI002235F731|nr:DNA-packaging protein [Heyndrickxia coagulans]MBX6333726.1 helix-turn-helix domain-containing protein [Candidatus Saccharibacteria bacterium]UZH06387.1 DNA-packaging protein [Heyndrickxia coagulans]
MAKGKYQEWLTPENLTLLEGWARDGLTDEQIAENIGIRRETLYDWKKRYPNISNALKRGKEVIDRQVENALLKRAIGYEYEEETQEYIPELDRMVVTKRVKKKQAPDVTAQIFWLKNRRPDKWRDKQDIEHSGSVKNEIDMSGLSLEELRKLAELDD